ncbi:MAG: sodium/solute symporter [Thermogutta sp.]|nr:sodium/solute symporter [Thermogutta sp.]
MVRAGLSAMVLLGLTASAQASTETGGPPAAPQHVSMSALDLWIVGGYLFGIVALGCLAGLRRRESKGSDYFLASKSLVWPMIGMALFATNISTIHLVSFAQNGYTSGLTYGNFEWMAAFTLVILSLFFAPFYLRANVATLPDFLERRFNRPCRDYLAILSIFSAVVVHIGFSLLTGAIVLEGTVLAAFVDSPEQYRFWTVVAMAAATAIYTIVGGLLAVVVTETIQTVVLLLGAACITWIGFRMIGGWGPLAESVHPVNLTILRSSADPTGITWYAVFLGYPVLGIWYWCTDQTIVQRVLGAKDENHARIGPLFAGFLKILPVFLFVLPGVICLGLVNTGKLPPLPELPDGSPNTEQTYTHMIKTMLNPGFRGIVIAALLAALMSTVSGALNSIATLFSYDIYKRWVPSVSERSLVWIGRCATFVAMCVAIAWTMALGQRDTTIYQAMVDVFPVVAPPTAATFVWGVFWRGTSAWAAFITLVGGSLLGLAVFLLTLSKVLTINSLFMAFILFAAESVAIVLLSLIFPHRHTAESESLVWKTPWEALRAEGAWRGLMDFRVFALVLVLVMAALYWAFSGSEPYFPVKAQLLLDGQPIVGCKVELQAENPRLDDTLYIGLDGRLTYGSVQRAGGAPAGTVLRLRLTPARDYIVEMQRRTGKDGRVETTEKIIAWVPHGEEITESVETIREDAAANNGLHGRVRVFRWRVGGTEKQVRTSADAEVEIRRATPIPDKLRAPEAVLIAQPNGELQVLELRSSGQVAKME